MATSWQPAAVASACTLATTGWGISWTASIIAVQIWNSRRASRQVRAAHVAEVVTGREHRAVGGEDDAERVAVRRPRGSASVSSTITSSGERVALLGAVQGDGRDGVVPLDEQVLVRHAAIVALLPRRPTIPSAGRTARTFVSDPR